MANLTLCKKEAKSFGALEGIEQTGKGGRSVMVMSPPLLGLEPSLKRGRRTVLGDHSQALSCSLAQYIDRMFVPLKPNHILGKSITFSIENPNSALSASPPPLS